MTGYDEILTVMDILSTKKTLATNVMSTASINCHGVKVRGSYILNTVLLAIILILIIIIIYYHYTTQKGIIWSGKLWIKKSLY